VSKKYQVLTEDHVQSFMQRGWLRLEGAFPREKAHEWTKDVFTRLGFDPDDKSTWTRDWTNMPSHKSELIETFSPMAWGAMADLLGGHERIHSDVRTWNDGIIANLGLPEYETEKTPHPREHPSWHCDGDFFLHFLDSPEQGLLVVPLFSDIHPRQGGTLIAEDSIAQIAKYLADHPEGVLPRGFPFNDIRDSCPIFTELTGKAGDVILLHPLMLHSKSHNNLRIPRYITNPAVALKEPFQFKREDGNYSLVELKTLKVLGYGPETGYEFKIQHEREKIVPDRVKMQAEWKKQELERLAKLNGNANGDANGVAPGGVEVAG